MQANTGIIKVIRAELRGKRSASIRCASPINPIPGTYFLAHNDAERDAVMGVPLFPVGLEEPTDRGELITLGYIPPAWQPGTCLNLFGPMGRGFHLPKNATRVALAAFTESTGRLLPLIHSAMKNGADVVLFANGDALPDSLPAAIEIHPLNSLSEILSWASFLALDMPIEYLSHLRKALNLGPHDSIPCRTQVLIQAAMPCGAIAECGVCAVPAKKGGYKYTCKVGPVFDLNELEW